MRHQILAIMAVATLVIAQPAFADDMNSSQRNLDPSLTAVDPEICRYVYKDIVEKSPGLIPTFEGVTSLNVFTSGRVPNVINNPSLAELSKCALEKGEFSSKLPVFIKNTRGRKFRAFLDGAIDMKTGELAILVELDRGVIDWDISDIHSKDPATILHVRYYRSQINDARSFEGSSCIKYVPDQGSPEKQLEMLTRALVYCLQQPFNFREEYIAPR